MHNLFKYDLPKKHFNKIKILDEVISLYFSRYNILKNLSSVNSFLFKYLYKTILF